MTKRKRWRKTIYSTTYTSNKDPLGKMPGYCSAGWNKKKAKDNLTKQNKKIIKNNIRGKNKKQTRMFE